MVDHSTRLSTDTAHGELPFDPPLEPADDADHGIEPFLSAAMGDAPVINSETAIDGIALSTYNPETGRAHLMYVSENLATMLGRKPQDLLGRSPEILIAPGTPIQQLSAVAAVVEEGKQAIVHLGLRHAAGHEVPVRATFLLVPSLPGHAPHFLALYRDLTPKDSSQAPLIDQSDMLDALARGNELGDVLRQVSDRVTAQIPNADCWIALADRTGALEPAISGNVRPDVITDLCRDLARTPFLNDPAVFTESGDPSTPRCVRVEDLDGAVGEELRERGVHSVWAFPFIGPDRRLRGLLLVAHGERSNPHPAEHQMLRQLSRVLAVAVDRNAAEASLAHQALHDPLTQLPNRALIIDRLEQAVARLGRDKTRLAALLVDLDKFKALNDSRGPDVGDQVLIEVSRRLRRSVRLGDTVGRIGGDQFLVLCVAVNDEVDASSMAERIVDSLAAPVHVPGGEFSITASVGVVLIDRPGDSPAAIISSAESALAKAVESGRGGYALYEEGWQRKVVIRHEVEQALHLAISSDELVLYYQPIVDVPTGDMVGAEGLIRWDRPGHGLLPPNEFIEIAEETGLIVPVGAWVIDEVCRQLSSWPTAHGGKRPFVSINLSARQLAEDSLIATVLGALERHDVQPEQLAFEVTESMRVEDVETASVSLRKLASIGCKISIDDFGIGYATLDYLRRFSMADTIKIDRSFVHGLGESREDTAIVTASIALAASLGLSVVAEGVETRQQYARLLEGGCQFAQGYALSPPVPLEQAHELWIERRLIDPATL